MYEEAIYIVTLIGLSYYLFKDKTAPIEEPYKKLKPSEGVPIQHLQDAKEWDNWTHLGPSIHYDNVKYLSPVMDNQFI